MTAAMVNCGDYLSGIVGGTDCVAFQPVQQPAQVAWGEIPKPN
jgi:hypothetical protein